MIIPNSTAGSKQLVYIAEIPEWRYNNDMITRKHGATRPVYIYDIWSYTDTSATWSPMWLSSYEDSAGSNVYKALPTGLPISKMIQSNAIEQMFSATINLSPLVPNSNEPVVPEAIDGSLPYNIVPPTWDAERILLRMAVYPAYALVISNTLEILDKISGPMFCESMTFECQEGGTVSITATLIGGKMIRYDNTVSDESVINYDNVYRTANFIDCFCSLNSGDHIVTGNSSIQLLSIGLSINQVFNRVFPCTVEVADEFGPRFIGLDSRDVTGSISILSQSPDFDVRNYTEVAMYFGGPFYFNMRNIVWQKPQSVIETNGGFVYSYQFIALADPDAKLSSNGNKLSEFYLSSMLK